MPDPISKLEKQESLPFPPDPVGQYRRAHDAGVRL